MVSSPNPSLGMYQGIDSTAESIYQITLQDNMHIQVNWWM